MRTDVALATQVFEHVVLVFSLHMIFEDGPGVEFGRAELAFPVESCGVVNNFVRI